MPGKNVTSMKNITRTSLVARIDLCIFCSCKKCVIWSGHLIFVFYFHWPCKTCECGQVLFNLLSQCVGQSQLTLLVIKCDLLNRVSRLLLFSSHEPGEQVILHPVLLQTPGPYLILGLLLPAQHSHKLFWVGECSPDFSIFLSHWPSAQSLSELRKRDLFVLLPITCRECPRKPLTF